jgi:putative lipoprotein
MRIVPSCCVFAWAALAACNQPSPAAPLRQIYQCGDFIVTAEFPTPDSVTLGWAGKSLALKRVPAASGAKYADGAGNEFWTRDGALFTLSGESLRRCNLK